MAAVRKITDLPDLISDLSPEEGALAERIFHVSTTTGRLDPPEAMYAWIEKSFGSVDNVTTQRIVKVTNRITAPFAGVVTRRFVDVGAFIPAATSGSAAQTAAVLTLMDFSTVRVQVARGVAK